MTSRILRYGPPAVAGLMVGFAIHAARAEDTVGSLLHNPKHLDAVQAGCKANAPWATESVCRTASEALRRRFPWPRRPLHAAPRRPVPEQADNEARAPAGDHAGCASPSHAPAPQRRPVTRAP